MTRQTYTTASLPVSKAVLWYVNRKLVEAGYEHAITRNVKGEPTLIDMNGLALTLAPDKPPRLCVVCGARVRNQNPAANTCSTSCTAKKNKKPDAPQVFRACPHCDSPVGDDAAICPMCEGDTEELKQ